MSRMRRRDFVSAPRRRGGGVAARGARAAAGANAAHRRAFPCCGTDLEIQARNAAFRQALQQLGWTDRPNVQIDYRWASSDNDRIREWRRNWSLSRRTSFWPRAARMSGRCTTATRTVPIVFVGVIDPVGAGFVDSLARPGGNAHGLHSVRIRHEREMAGAAQRDCAARDASGGPSRSRQSGAASASLRNPGRGPVARGGS